MGSGPSASPDPAAIRRSTTTSSNRTTFRTFIALVTPPTGTGPILPLRLVWTVAKRLTAPFARPPLRPPPGQHLTSAVCGRPVEPVKHHGHARHPRPPVDTVARAWYIRCRRDRGVRRPPAEQPSQLACSEVCTGTASRPNPKSAAPQLPVQSHRRWPLLSRPFLHHFMRHYRCPADVAQKRPGEGPPTIRTGRVGPPPRPGNRAMSH